MYYKKVLIVEMQEVEEKEPVRSQQNSIVI